MILQSARHLAHQHIQARMKRLTSSMRRIEATRNRPVVGN
jgi:hypothetical protein